jgi:hypothetical protein
VDRNGAAAARRDAARSAGHGDVVLSSPWLDILCSSRRRAISLEYTPATPLYSPTPAVPPEFLLRGTIAARRGAPPFYMIAGESSSMASPAVDGFTEPKLAPPSPPLAPWFPSRPTAAVAANSCLGLRRIVKTGHAPAEMSSGGEARRPPPQSEREA